MNSFKEKSEKVTAITVTYNRTITLRKCIQALLSQTHPLDEIIIVDNHSKPEEKAILDEIAATDPRIHLHILSDNMGGAGGFEAGMQLAKDQYPSDWYWIMDDDAYPRSNCLETLLKARDKITSGNKKQDIGFLTPLIYGVDLKDYQYYHHKYLKGTAFDSIPITEKYEDYQELNPVDANAFVGPLISKKAVELVGVADGSLFIYGDDTEYTFRVTRKLPGIMVRDAVIDHQDPPIVNGNYLEPKGWWKEYYSNRNRIFLITKFAGSTAARLSGYASIAYQLFGLAAAAAVKPKYKGYHSLRVHLLMKSLKDGLTNKRGKNIDPAAYNRMLAEMKK